MRLNRRLRRVDLGTPETSKGKAELDFWRMELNR